MEVTETGASSASAEQARKWWTRVLARIAIAREAEPASLITAAHVAEIVQLVESGALTDRLAQR